MEKQIKIGVMGCANIADKTVIPTILSLPEFELIAVASRSESKASVFADKFGCESVVGYDNLVSRTDIDVVYMPLPTGIHEEWVIKCLDAGKHILIEKSLADNFDSAKKMVTRAREKSLLIMENFMFLYHRQHAFVKELIADNEIGDLRCFRSSFGFPPLADDNFRYDRQLGGGALLDAAAYTVRASSLFLGPELKAKASHLNINERKKIDIHGGAFLVNENGVIAELAFGFDNFYQCNYEIWGNKGKITAHKSFTPRANEEPKITLEKQGDIVEYSINPDDHFYNILTELRNVIISGYYQDKYEEILTQSKLIDDIRNLNLV